MKQMITENGIDIIRSDFFPDIAPMMADGSWCIISRSYNQYADGITGCNVHFMYTIKKDGFSKREAQSYKKNYLQKPFSKTVKKGYWNVGSKSLEYQYISAEQLKDIMEKRRNGEYFKYSDYYIWFLNKNFS